MVLEAFIVPVIPNCDPLNVKLPLSSIAPELPARTIRPDVKSLTVAEDKVVSAPVTDNPHEELQRNYY